MTTEHTNRLSAMGYDVWKHQNVFPGGWRWAPPGADFPPSPWNAFANSEEDGWNKAFAHARFTEAA